MKRLYVIIFIIVTSTFLSAKDIKTPSRLSRPLMVEFEQFDVNQISSWLSNVGEYVSYRVTSDAGLEWPQDSRKTAVFQTGFWLIGKVNGEIRTATAEYSSEFQPGVVDYAPEAPFNPGIPSDPEDISYQIYKINRGDSSDPQSPHYNPEYVNWPVEQGAPAHDGEYFTDTNGNGQYDDGEDFEDYNLNGIYDPPDGEIVQGMDPPLLFADQLIWSVFNDFGDNHDKVFKTDPLGVEVQSLVFGYDTRDPLRNVMFIYLKIINKSGARIDSLYFTIWTDDDIGDATNDFVGCDPELNLGFTYNGFQHDMVYGYTSPAVGIPFFRGPVIEQPGSQVYDLLTAYPDLANLPMTSFGRIQKSHPITGDPNNFQEAFNLVKTGRSGGGYWINPLTGDTTLFPCDGDPVLGIGWTEKVDDVPGDRRYSINSGPITMEPWQDLNGNLIPEINEPGVERILTGIVIGQGQDHLNSISALKYTVRYAQTFIDNNFQPLYAPAPRVSVSELDKTLILHWDESREEIEAYQLLDYQFEGYNIYQGYSPEGLWKKIATFDIKNDYRKFMEYTFDPETNLFSTDYVYTPNTGIKYSYKVTRDSLQKKSLMNNREYYFAVTSFYQNLNRIPEVLESEKSVIKARPHGISAPIGSKYSLLDTVLLEHYNGNFDGEIKAIIYDPLYLKNQAYALRFASSPDPDEYYYYFGRIDTGSSTMIDTLIPFTRCNAQEYWIETEEIDGFQLLMENLLFTLKKRPILIRQISNVEPSYYDTVLAPLAFQDRLDSLVILDGDTVNVDSLYPHPYFYCERVRIDTVTYFRLIKRVYHDLFVRTALSLGSPTSMASDLGFEGGISDTDTTRLTADIEIRFTRQGQNLTLYNPFSEQKTLYHVPFELWDVENNQQLCGIIYDRFDSGAPYDTTTGEIFRSYVIIVHLNYATYGDSLFNPRFNPNTSWLIFFDKKSRFSFGDVIRLYFYKPIITGVDEFRFIPYRDVNEFSSKQLKKQLKKINVFPNPYFGYNPEGGGLNPEHVTFINLPEKKCIIRIYTLGGSLVKKILHDGTTTYQEWNLRNEKGLKVASGIYIVHIKAPDIGDKVLKLAVFSRKY